jgi:hypothetical protein
MLGSHGYEYEDDSFLGYSDVQSSGFIFSLFYDAFSETEIISVE